LKIKEKFPLIFKAFAKEQTQTNQRMYLLRAKEKEIVLVGVLKKDS